MNTDGPERLVRPCVNLGGRVRAGFVGLASMPVFVPAPLGVDAGPPASSPGQASPGITMEGRQFIASSCWYWGHWHRDSTRHRCSSPLIRVHRCCILLAGGTAGSTVGVGLFQLVGIFSLAAI